MTRIVVIIGSGRNVGKTLLGETIVSIATGIGLRVWCVKHVHHGVDYRVKDTGRYLAAGSERVYAISPRETLIVEKRPLPLRRILEEASDKSVDLVVIEGFRSILEEIREYNPLVTCIGISEEYCDVKLEPGFEPRRAALVVLKSLGYGVGDETS